MTKLLQKAFDAAAKLPEAEQEVLAKRLLAELGGEHDFDQTLARMAHRLAGLAGQALKEHGAGLTRELDPESL
jgi:hypothetical protein